MFSVVTILQKEFYQNSLSLSNVNFESDLARAIVQPIYNIALEWILGCFSSWVISSSYNWYFSVTGISQRTE